MQWVTERGGMNEGAQGQEEGKGNAMARLQW